MIKKISLSIILLVMSVSALAEFNPDAPTVLITGSNRGIGFELAKQYAENGWNVIATARRESDDPGLADLRSVREKHSGLVIERIDVTDSDMIRGVAAKYKDQPIDVLINNAARVQNTFQKDLEVVNKEYNEIDWDDALFDFSVNSVGPMRMIQAFMPSIMASKQKKIVNVTSFIGSFGYQAPMAMGMNYGSSKAALNMYSVKLAEQLRDDEIIVSLVEPVMVQSKPGTELIPMASPADVEIKKLRKIIAELTMEQTGIIMNFSTGNVDPF